MRTPQFKNEEAAALAVSEKVDSIHRTLCEIVQIADQYGLHVEVLREWGNYLSYTGRPYIDEYCEMREDGGWYSSTC